MTWGATAVAGATVVGGYLSGQQAAGAQASANSQNTALSRQNMAQTQQQFNQNLQERALEREIGQSSQLERRQREALLNQQQRDQFMALRGENLEMLQPYQQTGTQATGQLSALLGLGTPEDQAVARSAFSESPGQSFLRDQQERSLLRNAAAIGGLGGGNVRTGLQEQAFGRAQTDYQNYLSQLGALSGQGMSAARGGLESGYGPSYMQTGQDTGIADTTLSLQGYGTQDALTQRQRQLQGIQPQDLGQQLQALLNQQQQGTIGAMRGGVNRRTIQPPIVDRGFLPNPIQALS